MSGSLKWRCVLNCGHTVEVLSILRPIFFPVYCTTCHALKHIVETRRP